VSRLGALVADLVKDVTDLFLVGAVVKGRFRVTAAKQFDRVPGVRRAEVGSCLLADMESPEEILG